MHVIETLEEAARLQVRDPERLALLTQTTLSVDDTRELIARLRERFPAIRVPAKDDICYATQNRQNAVKALAARASHVLVVGAPSSSNSNRLVEVARAQGADARLVENAECIEPHWALGARTLGVTAGASTPDALVAAVVERLHGLGFERVEELVLTREDVRFALPLELKREAAALPV
jgi:4-hydroxy-3-methylbut-2-enyl diphosphate reductase